MTLAARAPGKLFVTGEYAVLGGAPALVAAVDRYAGVRVRRVGAPGLVIDAVAEGTRRVVEPDDEGPLPGGDVGVVLAAWRALRARLDVPSDRGFHLHVDSRPFLEGSHKLGLGRSAATLVAVVAALLAATGVSDRALVLALAVAAHGAFQNGTGSGADVAAAWHGGLVQVRRRGDTPDVCGRTLPGGLRLLVGWTGESAPTTPMLHRFADATAPAAPDALARLHLLAGGAADAVARGDATALRHAVRETAVALADLGRETGLPIVTPALARLVAAAEGVGAVAKPSGAGGGDCGIALVDSPAQAAAVADAWRVAGIRPLPLAIAEQGVTVG